MPQVLFHPLFALTGRVALAARTARKMGWAIVGIQAKAGAHLGLAGLQTEGTQATAERLTGQGGRVAATAAVIGGDNL